MFIQDWIKLNIDAAKWNHKSLRKYAFLTVEEVKKAYNNGLFDEYAYGILKKNSIGRCLVYCISRQELNSIMWAIYAECGKGMCISFKAKNFRNFSNIKFYKVILDFSTKSLKKIPLQ